MDLHICLDDSEVEYLQSIGLTDTIEEALTEVGGGDGGLSIILYLHLYISL